MHSFKKMVKFVIPYYRYSLLGLTLGILEIGFHLSIPYIFKMFIDEALTNKNHDLLMKSVLAYLLVTFSIVLLGFLKEMVYRITNEKIVRDNRVSLYRHLRNLKLKKLSGYKLGKLMSYFINDIPKMSDNLASGLMDVIINLVRLSVGIITLALLDVKMLLFVLILLPFYLFNAKLFNKSIRNSTKEVQEQKSTISDSLQEHISGSTEIMVFNRQEWDIAKLRKVFSKYIKLAVKNSMWMRASNDTGFMIYWAATILIYYIGGLKVLDGTMTIGTLLFYARYIDNVYMPAKLLIILNNNIQSNIAAGERYFDFFQRTSEGKNEKLKRTNKIDDFKNKLELENVSFSYDDDLVLKNISFDIKKGETVAVVGPSGSGKSTLIKLLLNLYTPTSGEISIDDKNIESINSENLYNIMSVVFQEPFLFSDTVYDNIRFSKPEASLEEVIGASKLSGAEEFINNLNNKYSTHIGERGSTLSGGQKQRLAIARGILKESEILIFDEVTSSLDTANKNIIYDSIEKMKEKNKTIILITHRLKDIECMDKIIVLNDGEIVGAGTHDELIKTCSLYEKLYIGE